MATRIRNSTRESTAARGAGKLRALGDQTRLSVLIALLRDGPQHVSKLQALLGMEQSLLSQHLRQLRILGVVRGVREGRRMLYTPSDSISVGRDTNTIHLDWCTVVIPKSSLW